MILKQLLKIPRFSKVEEIFFKATSKNCFASDLWNTDFVDVAHAQKFFLLVIQCSRMWNF